MSVGRELNDSESVKMDEKQQHTAEKDAGSLALVCPYCGATLTINLETEGRPYLTYEVPESIECYATDCGATWEPNGELRDAPSWVRYPDLFDPPARAVEWAARRVTPPGVTR